MTVASPGRPRPEQPAPYAKWIYTLLLAAVLVWAVVSTNARWSRVVGAPADIYSVFRLMFSRMSWDYVGRCIEAMWESIAIAWLGTLIAAVFAIPLSFLAAENLVPRWLSFIIRQVFNVLRAIPEVIIVLALIPIFGLSTTAGILTLGIGSIGTLGKLCTEVVESIDKGPIEAADAVGASYLERLRWTVLPQSLPEIASFVLYRFEINIRVSAVLGALGAGGIGGILRDNLVFRNYGMAGVALIVVVLATIAVDLVSGAVRRRLVYGPRQSRSDSAPTERLSAAEL